MRLRELRQAKGWSQEKLEEYSGVTRSQIGRIERGEVKPRLETILKLCQALGVSFAELTGDVDKHQYEEMIRKERLSAEYLAALEHLVELLIMSAHMVERANSTSTHTNPARGRKVDKGSKAKKRVAEKAGDRS